MMDYLKQYQKGQIFVLIGRKEGEQHIEREWERNWDKLPELLELAGKCAR
ncbi:hypothetical protein [Aquibacillus albus]|uniref:Uncharacterized protein n=1 Tax=Aquibacillus albus TaxID=1168171 RepID=A0ABS2N6B3_9BACI|nr:hypothetical protein [Aquibacillus albus]MBM7573648.1 hypothetical protein [Aquibacillus albus]